MAEMDFQRPLRRPWLERGAFLGAIAVLGLWLAYDNLVSIPHTVFVDGKPIVTLESRQDAKSVLNEVTHRQLSGKVVASPAFTQRVALRRATKDAEIDTSDNAVSTLDAMLVLKAHAYAILVDDAVTIGLAKEPDANRALDLMKQRYSSRLKNLDTKPTFKENVLVQRRYLPVDAILADPEKAAEFMASVHEKPTYHTLKQGDRAVRLTAQYGISLDELKGLNPGVDVNRLTEGDRLLIRRPRSPVTVVTRALTTEITPVEAPAGRHMAAKTGKRQTWAVITYENGIEVRRDVTRVMTTWDKSAPKPAYSGKWRRKSSHD